MSRKRRAADEVRSAERTSFADGLHLRSKVVEALNLSNVFEESFEHMGFFSYVLPSLYYSLSLLFLPPTPRRHLPYYFRLSYLEVVLLYDNYGVEFPYGRPLPW